jgi:hypothetical protein
MSVKFRVGFDIDAETLFGMIAKMLPIDNLSVEEFAPTEAPKKQAMLPRQAPAKRLQRKSPGPNLEKGINKVIIEILSNGESRRAVEMEPKIKAAGYAKNSVTSRLEFLRAQKIVERHAGGWRLVKR